MQFKQMLGNFGKTTTVTSHKDASTEHVRTVTQLNMILQKLSEQPKECARLVCNALQN